LNGTAPGSDPALNAIIDASMSNGNDSDDRMSMSDEAAAEVLLGVGRRHHGSSPLSMETSNLKRDADHEAEEYDQLDESQSQAKTRRSKRARTSRKHKSKKDVHEEDEEEEVEPAAPQSSTRGAPTRTLSREAQSLVQAMQLHRESDPSLNEERYAQRGQICAPHGGLDLPPLNAALGLTNLLASGSYPASRDITAPSSRAHSHSPTSFARTILHANSGLHSLNSHSMLNISHTHSVPNYSNTSGYRSSHLQLQPPASAPSPPESNVREVDQNQHGRSSSHYRIPAYTELESHYHQLYSERRRLEEMLEKTDDMLSNVKRGLEQMRYSGLSGHSVPQSRSPLSLHHVQGQEPAQQSSTSVRLPTPHHGDRRETVWPVEEQRHHQN
jgi:GATA-binding protein, other eukaryote